jgi:hypothetical protein
MVNYPYDANMTNVTGHLAQKSMEAYNYLLGEFALAFMLLFIGGAIYVGTKGDKALTAIYFVVVGVVFGPILNLWIASLTSLFAGIIITLMIAERFFGERMK